LKPNEKLYNAFHSCIDFVTLSTILIFDFGIVPTMWYFLFLFYSYLGVTKGSGLHAAYETLHKSFIPSGTPVSTTNDCSLGDQSNQHADKHVESSLTCSNIQITLETCTSGRHHNKSAWHGSYNGKIFILYSFYYVLWLSLAGSSTCVGIVCIAR